MLKYLPASIQSSLSPERPMCSSKRKPKTRCGGSVVIGKWWVWAHIETLWIILSTYNDNDVLHLKCLVCNTQHEGCEQDAFQSPMRDASANATCLFGSQVSKCILSPPHPGRSAFTSSFNFPCFTLISMAPHITFKGKRILTQKLRWCRIHVVRQQQRQRQWRQWQLEVT